jgi:hypothetical protein
MTPRQIELARHALGLRPGRLVSNRNVFVVDCEADRDEWCAMVAAGTAEIKPLTFSTEWTAFKLTRAGAERALLPGDVLDPEDWGI